MDRTDELAKYLRAWPRDDTDPNLTVALHSISDLVRAGILPFHQLHNLVETLDVTYRKKITDVILTFFRDQDLH